jgi:hypothetical protein
MISIAYITETCCLSENIEQKKLKVPLDMAMDNLRHILGIDFYNELLSQYNTNPSSFTAANQALYDPYVKKYLAWQTYLYHLIFANQASTPTGIRSFNDDNSSILEDISMHALEKNIQQRMNFYKFDMMNFLSTAKSNDSNAYPLYSSCNKQEFSFAVTSIGGCNDTQFRIMKAINTNE